MGSHGDELTGHLQIHLLALLQIRQILVKDQGNGDVLYFNFVFAQQEQDQIQRPLEILQRLAALGLHHPFQLKDQIVQRFCSSEADDAAE